MKIAATDETVALGAALMGAHAAYKEKDIKISYNELQDRSCTMLEKVYLPNSENVETYNKIYTIYKKLHDAFGIEGTKIEMYGVMKDLIEIKNN